MTKNERLQALYIEHLKGDNGATYKIIQEFNPTIKKLLYQRKKILKDSIDDANDFIQSCDLIIINALKDYDPRRGDLEKYINFFLYRKIEITPPEYYSVSIHTEINNEGATLEDILEDVGEGERMRDRMDIEAIYEIADRVLTKQEKKIFKLCYNPKKERTMSQIAEMIGCSKQYVSATHDRAIKKIKKEMNI